jgi:hypothetical protein
VIRNASGWACCSWDHEGGIQLLPAGQVIKGALRELPRAAALLPAPSQGVPALLCFAGSGVWLQHLATDLRSPRPLDLGCILEVPNDSGLWGSPPISWCRVNNDLQLAVLNADGALYWARLEIQGWHLKKRDVLSHAPEGGYRAATLVRPGLVAAVTRTRIDWLRAGDRFHQVAQTAADLSEAVACLASLPNGELLIVCNHGTLVQVPLPD